MQRGKRRYQFVVEEENPQAHSRFFFFCSYLEELELIFPVQFYSWCLILTVKQYTTPRAVNTMRPAPAGRFMARYSTARASDASDRLDFSRGDGCCSAFIAKRGTAERLQATEECVFLSTRSQMVPHNTAHPPPSPFAGTAVSNVWVCHSNDWLNFAEILLLFVL